MVGDRPWWHVRAGACRARQARHLAEHAAHLGTLAAAAILAFLHGFRSVGRGLGGPHALWRGACGFDLARAAYRGDLAADRQRVGLDRYRRGKQPGG